MKTGFDGKKTDGKAYRAARKKQQEKAALFDESCGHCGAVGDDLHICDVCGDWYCDKCCTKDVDGYWTCTECEEAQVGA